MIKPENLIFIIKTEKLLLIPSDVTGKLTT